MDTIEEVLRQLREQRAMTEKRLDGLNGAILALETGYDRAELRLPRAVRLNGSGVERVVERVAEELERDV